MSKNILHIMDDEKVIDRTIEFFESVYPNKNIFIVLLGKNETRLKYVENEEKVIRCKFDDTTEIFASLDKVDHVIIHFLDDKKIKLLEGINHPNITWMAWGADLYNDLLVHRGYKLYRDASLPKKTGLLSRKRRYLPFLGKVIDKIRLEKRIKVIKKIRNIAAIDDDYNLLTKYFPELSHLRRIDFFYYPIDVLLGKELLDKTCYGRKIMLGNSSSPNANHLFALEILSIKCNDNHEVLIPLSYGHIGYRNWLISKFSKFPNLIIIAIQDFMPLNEYINLLLGCGNFIYANLRQEALGNILVALYIGGKVFLDKKNPLYNYLKKLNIILYALEDINDLSLNVPMSNSDLIHNREVIMNNFSYEKLVYLIKKNFPI